MKQHKKYSTISSLVLCYCLLNMFYYTYICNVNGKKTGNICIPQTHEHAAKNIAGSRLKIVNLDVSDIGFYACRVTNGKDQIQSEGTLRVDSSKSRHGESNMN